ncbi:uncharacterized protein BT62DRAFT_1079045 [Guyanagaster necrorhizus]|uniref:Uncharacterized protein n=1 Tax=Guyanagaster necrorhizus TaxID=856835 RepID=A0A9P7VK93_9AGAR|nr:uncharacterized protein BT62DRAFT_1079045 [Guyanagaster necrorhizus MCA 3950]KAG7442666.1 hypothetical protein BT62DRAFT_1079045 [Guyanagaster necrorhizus MCA 3950]
MLFVGNVAREEADSVGQVMDRYNSLEHTHTMVPVGDVSARHAVRALGGESGFFLTTVAVVYLLDIVQIHHQFIQISDGYTLQDPFALMLSTSNVQWLSSSLTHGIPLVPCFLTVLSTPESTIRYTSSTNLVSLNGAPLGKQTSRNAQRQQPTAIGRFVAFLSLLYA